MMDVSSELGARGSTGKPSVPGREYLQGLAPCGGESRVEGRFRLREHTTVDDIRPALPSGP